MGWQGPNGKKDASQGLPPYPAEAFAAHPLLRFHRPTMAVIALNCPDIEVVVLDINEGTCSTRHTAARLGQPCTQALRALSN